MPVPIGATLEMRQDRRRVGDMEQAMMLTQAMATIKTLRQAVHAEQGSNAVWEMLWHAWEYLNEQLEAELHAA